MRYEYDCSIRLNISNNINVSENVSTSINIILHFFNRKKSDLAAVSVTTYTYLAVGVTVQSSCKQHYQHYYVNRKKSDLAAVREAPT